MDVELYIYDLSRGMARQLSRQLTGTFIEAIYHTAVVVGGVEYFYGHGIYRKMPGSTHHGRPMEILHLGKTDLPTEVIQEYVESLESIYTPEAYDLFHNNCNNFTQDMSVFLVGKDIPTRIRDLPQQFLATPMGQMMRGVMDESLRSMTQAPDAVSGRSVARPSQVANGRPTTHPHMRLKLPGLQYKINTPIAYRKVPSLEKLMAKLEPVKHEEIIQKLADHIKAREANGADEAPLPGLPGFHESFTEIRDQTPRENQFALTDLVRIASIDPRFGSWLVAEEERLESTISLSIGWTSQPVNYQMVTLQLACNLFTSPVFQEKIKTCSRTRQVIAHLTSCCLLTSSGVVRSLAATLLYNLAAFDHNERLEGRLDQIKVDDMEGIEEALVQAVIDENESKDVLHSLLLALGMLLYCAPGDAMIWDLCDAMELKTCIELRSQGARFSGEPLLKETLTLLSSRRDQ